MHGNCDSSCLEFPDSSQKSIPSSRLQEKSFLPCDDFLSTSCLIGSPTRVHNRTEDIVCMDVAPREDTASHPDAPSAIMKMLGKLKADVQSLKSGRASGKPMRSFTRPQPQSHPSRSSNDGKSNSTAKDKLKDIEEMLLEAEHSIQFLNERMNKTNTRHPI